ncbi:MAG: phosphoribosylglycinamide formyltransferase [Clostridia bacterium]|nr:phosphoribosylglycinamide formyltransferase [Clostridia bacterium]
MIPTAVLVSGGGTNLQALIDSRNSGALTSADLALVVADRPGIFALERAKAAGIRSIVINKKELGRERFEAELSRVLAKHGIKLIVLAGFLCILSKDFTDKWPRRIINVHPSLIPSFCGEGFWGLKVHEAALEKGVKVTGATVHYVNEIPDGGEIIVQKAVTVPEGITPKALQKRVMKLAEWKILPKALQIAAEKIEKEN